MSNITDGTGKGYQVKVNSKNQLAFYGVTESAQEDATYKGKAFNINTGIIALTGTSDSGILYFKNNEPPENGESAYAITALAVGLGTRSATVTDLALVTVVRNPTAGTLISNASPVASKANANFGSSLGLDSGTLVYKGAQGYTMTDGSDYGYFMMSEGRLFASLNIIIPKGSSIGIKIDLNTSGGANVYAALIGHKVDAAIV